MKLSDLQFKLKQIADFVIEETYSNLGERKLNNYKNFNLVLSEKEYKSRLGIYRIQSKTVEVSSVNKVYFYDIIITLLHELAHHIEYCDNKTTGHSANFYKIHTQLLFRALDASVISYEDVMKTTETSLARNKDKFANMVSKYVKRDARNISSVCDLSFVKEYNKLSPINEVIKVKCQSKDSKLLKDRGYLWSPEEKIWHKTFYKQPEYNAEVNFLIENKFCNFKLNGFSYFVNEIVFVVYGNTYRHRDKLKELNYNFIDKEWRKIVPVANHRSELTKLYKINGIRLKYEFVQKIKQKTN